MYFRKPNRSHSAESGYVLLALMLVLTLLLIAMSIEAPRLAQQIKRQKEEELVHRGRDYATAVKRFVHKNGGQYPLSVEQLENTNHIRFLRKKYIDPMTGESDWKLVHTGEAQIVIPTANPGLNPSTQNPGLSGSTPGTTSNPQPGGASNTFGGTSGSTFGGSSGSSGSTFGGSSFSGGSTPPVLNAGSQTGAPAQAGSNGQLGSLATNGIGNGQTAGGGQIIGVASVSKGQSIKEFNDKDHYNEWLFVYDLRLEQSGGTGVTVAAPIAATAAAGAANGNNPTGNANNPNGNNPNGNNPNAGGNNQNLNNPSGSQPPSGGQSVPVTPAPGATPVPN
jgi:type II secretory pathway pseudopilin PulG